jgi:hypothetical protein
MRRARIASIAAVFALAACEPPLAVHRSEPPAPIRLDARTASDLAQSQRVLAVLVAQGAPSASVSSADPKRAEALRRLPPSWWAELARNAAPFEAQTIAASKAAAAADAGR